MNGTLIPLNDRVLIEPLEEQETMYGSIIVPDLGKERPELGTVVAVGAGRLSEFSGEWIPVNCKVGDIVLVPKIGTIRIELKGKEYYVAQDKEILAIYKPEINTEDQ
jgi:chaperonin GroES